MPLMRVPTVTGLGREKTGWSLFTSATGQQMPKRETMAPALAELTCHFPLQAARPACTTPQAARPAMSASASALPARAHACQRCDIPRSSCMSLACLACLRDCVRESADLYIRDYQELIHELQRPVDSQNQAE